MFAKTHMWKTHLEEIKECSIAQQWEDKWPNLKLGRRVEETFHQKRCRNGTFAYGKMLHSWSHQGNANEKHKQVRGHTQEPWPERGETVLHCRWECKLGQPLGRTVWQVFIKSIVLTRGPSSFTPTHLPKRQENIRLWKDTCVNVHMQLYYPNWEQHECPSVGRWRSKWWLSRAVESFTAIARVGNELCGYRNVKWKTDTKDHPWYDSVHRASRKGKTIERNWQNRCQRQGVEEGHEGLFEVMEMSSIVMVVGGYKTTHESDSWDVYLKRMNFKEWILLQQITPSKP